MAAPPPVADQQTAQLINPPNNEIHYNFTCDGCGQQPIQGPRHHSLVRENFDLCQSCHDRTDRDAAFGLLPGHSFARATIPVATFGGCPAFPFQGFAKGLGKSLSEGISTSNGVHHGVSCDGCGQSPIGGVRHRSLEWSDFDLCLQCHDRADRAETLGVMAEHKFEHVPAPTVEAPIQQILDDLKHSGVDLCRVVPKFAEVCMSAVQTLGHEDLFPLLDLLLPLASGEVSDMADLSKQCVKILEIIQQSNWQAQKQFWSHCCMSMPSVLAELEMDVSSLFGPCMGKFLQPCAGDWQTQLFKRLGKGFAKGLCKGKGKGCRGKGLNKMAQKSTSGVNTMEAAMQALLVHPCDAIRSAAEEALEAASNQAEKPSVPMSASIEASIGKYDGHPEDLDNSIEHNCIPADGFILPQAAFVGEVAAEQVLSVDFDSTTAGDVSVQWSSMLEQFPLMSRAYNLGCVSKSSEDAHITLCFSLLNTGAAPWPSNTAFRIAAGDPCGSESILVGQVSAGDVTEINLHLRLSTFQSPRSSWALEIDGQPFGPLLMLDLC